MKHLSYQSPSPPLIFQYTLFYIFINNLANCKRYKKTIKKYILDKSFKFFSIKAYQRTQLNLKPKSKICLTIITIRILMIHKEPNSKLHQMRIRPLMDIMLLQDNNIIQTQKMVTYLKTVLVMIFLLPSQEKILLKG